MEEAIIILLNTLIVLVGYVFACALFVYTLLCIAMWYEERQYEKGKESNEHTRGNNTPRSE